MHMGGGGAILVYNKAQQCDIWCNGSKSIRPTPNVGRPSNMKGLLHVEQRERGQAIGAEMINSKTRDGSQGGISKCARHSTSKVNQGQVDGQISNFKGQVMARFMFKAKAWTGEKSIVIH